MQVSAARAHFAGGVVAKVDRGGCLGDDYRLLRISSTRRSTNSNVPTCWGTEQGIHNIGGRRREPGVHVSDDELGREIDGLTERNLEPEAYKAGRAEFANKVNR
jgi:hypothetical protein